MVGCEMSGSRSTGSRVSEMPPSRMMIALIINIMTGRSIAERECSWSLLTLTSDRASHDRAWRRLPPDSDCCVARRAVRLPPPAPAAAPPPRRPRRLHAAATARQHDPIAFAQRRRRRS